MKIAIGNDHGGFKAKTEVVKFLQSKGYDVIDLGCFDEESCDYPDYAKLVCKCILDKKAELGVLICTSGEGICIAANKFKGIRCGIGYNDEVSELMRRHNHANIIAFGQKFMSVNEICRRTEIFLNSSEEEGRHNRRVEKIEKDI